MAAMRPQWQVGQVFHGTQTAPQVPDESGSVGALVACGVAGGPRLL